MTSASKPRLVLTGGDIVFPDGVLRDGVVILDDGRIEAALPREGFSPEPGDHIIPCPDTFICPGFIDLHNQGGGGFSVDTGDEESIAGMCRFHAAHGTTGLLLTPRIERASYRTLLPVLAAACGKAGAGAVPLGIHAEGPFLNPVWGGGIPQSAMCEPDDALFRDILDAAGDALVMMTIAPELPGALEYISTLARDGVVASLGHSGATLHDTLKAIDHGASHVTHLFNAMRPLHHREPGLAGTALYTAELTVDIIADKYHLHPWVMGLTVQNKRPGFTCLVTDAMSLAGSDDGDYDCMGQRVRLQHGRLTIADNPAVLAGSVITMDEALGNVMNMLGLSIVDAVLMASTAPASVLGIEDRLGRIADGYEASITVIDRTYRTVRTIVGGAVVYDRENA